MCYNVALDILTVGEGAIPREEVITECKYNNYQNSVLYQSAH
jgi:hypothetical protein